MSFESGQSSSNPYAAPQSDIDAFRASSTPGDVPALGMATRGSRFAAALVDGLIFLVSLSPVFLSVDWSSFVKAGQTRSSFWFIGSSVAQIVGTVLWLAVWGFQAWLITTTGQSIGKRFLGIKIVMMDGTPVGFVRGVLIRSWTFAILGFIPVIKFLGVVDLLFIFGSEQRCIHDRLAGTRVVRQSAF